MKNLLFAVAKMFIIPTILVGLLVFAFLQTFTVGLIIMLSMLIVQIILSHGSNQVLFSWDYFDNLKFSSNKHELIAVDMSTKGLNILFNLSKVACILAIMGLSYVHHPNINPISDTVITVATSLFAIILLTFILRSRKGNSGSYTKLRVVIAVVVIISILIFAYFYFGTQSIWLPLVLACAFAIFEGFNEIAERAKIKIDVFILTIIFGLLSLAIVSTVVQFWVFLVDVFWDCVTFLERFLAPIMTILFLVIVFFIWRSLKMRNLRMIQRKIAEKKEAEVAKQESIIQEELERINVCLRDGKITKSQISYLAQHYQLAKHQIPIKSLEIDLTCFVKISKLKQHIVWDNNLEDILVFLDYLASKSYDDDELNFIIVRVKALCDYVSQHKDFKAFGDFRYMVRRATQNIPYSLWLTP